MKAFTVHCPTCAAPVAWSEDAPWRPFCSRRCRLIDLGQWAGEEYRIPGPPLPSDGGQAPAGD